MALDYGTASTIRPRRAERLKAPVLGAAESAASPKTLIAAGAYGTKPDRFLESA
jgi:hypothetical protein